MVALIVGVVEIFVLKTKINIRTSAYTGQLSIDITRIIDLSKIPLCSYNSICSGKRCGWESLRQ